MNNLGFTGRISIWSARHHWLVIAGWIIGTAVLVAGSSAIGSRLTTDIEFSSKPDSQVARELLQDARGGTDEFWEQVVVQSETLTVDDPAYQEFVTSLTNAIRATDGAVEPQRVANTYELQQLDPEQAAGLVSADRKTTIIAALLVGGLDEATENVVLLEETLVEYDANERFDVVTGGFASVNEAFTKAAEEDLKAEQNSLPVALLILVLVFGAVVAALLPMAIAMVAIIAVVGPPAGAYGLIALLSQFYEMSFFVTNVALMIGLAVGIDYALFVIARYREERRHGRDKYEAIGIAGDTGARAVVFSGITVVIALFGMFVVPTTIFRSFAIGASSVVLVTLLQSVTLLPAVVSIVGDNINRLSIPFIGGNADKDEERGFWAGAARFVMAHPWPMALGTSALLIVMSLPYFSINLGRSGTASLPERFTARQAFDILDAEFSAGRIQPTEIVIQADDVNDPSVQAAIADLRDLLAADSRYQLVNGVQILRDDLASVAVAVPGEEASDEAIEAMKFIRSDLVPAAFNGVDADVYVGGPTAGNSDFFDVVDAYTPWVFAFVLGFSFILLTLIFRSLVVPAKSIVMNLLSVGASYGVVVAVFQWGWLAEPLGFTQVESIEAWLPLFMFTILFGLSMDYHIFLLSRIRERFDETHDNAESVAFGLRHTANIITGAAAIMVAVFAGFALGDMPMFQQIGVGLAASVFLDATIVRTILVPATMRLLGDRNWWMPSWLNWLPDLRVEREPAGARAVTPVGMAGGD